MRANISFVTLGVSNVAASTAFYEAMGLTKHSRSNEHISFFDMSGMMLGLFSRDALAEDANLQLKPHGFGGIALAHNVAAEADVQTLIDTAVTAGGTQLRPASPPPWGGLRGYFADPDGHAWEVACNPGMNIDADGRVSF
jgi:catechol 2,3-dioxygenase-like lactoylglutathione lyase family enzyme|tara:strand:- start:14 stop:433 length:420 start_codon:yes stop_codon:yes gene_type:complete